MCHCHPVLYKASSNQLFIMQEEGDSDMEVQCAAAPESLEVILSGRSVVKASNPSATPQILTLSNLDLLSGRFPVTYLYFYPKPTNGMSFGDMVESLRCSLAQTLDCYHPFAGRILANPTSGEPEIVCDNSGALVTEGHANIAMNKLDWYNLGEYCLQGKLVSVIDSDYPLQVQATGYNCGGISITFTFDHALGDAAAFSRFLLSWSEIAQNKPISCMPDHRRSLVIRPRYPPYYHPRLDQTFVKCTMEEILNMPATTTRVVVKRLYHIEASSIHRLHQLASANGGRKRTLIEAFSAYAWKIMAAAIHGEGHETCKMGWLVNGRGRMCDPEDKNSMSNYIGNVLSVAVAETGVRDVQHGALSDVATIVHDAIAEVANRQHFLDLIDWVECHRPGVMMSNIVLGRGGPALVLSSGRRFPVAELEFGFGRPAMGTVCSTIEKIGVSYMNQRPSGRNDGSWTVSAILWPQLAAALESDSVFQPMSTAHLHL